MINLKHTSLVALLLFCTHFGFAQFITTRKTDNNGNSNSDQITIPTFNAETYNYDVDWGDGNSDTGITGDATHTYAAVGTYTVTITGTFPRIYFNNSGDKEKLLTIENWGSQSWASIVNAFYGCSKDRKSVV